MTGRWRAWLVAALLPLAAGCFDGYPSEDAQPFRPAEMTQDERLATMNLLGRQRHLDRRWRYELVPSCELKVTTGRFLGRQSLVVPLHSAQIRQSLDAAAKTHAVRLQADGEPRLAAVAVLDGGRRADAIQMSLLLQHLRQDCLAVS